MIVRDTIYPGHPCLIAMQIMTSFANYEEANRRNKNGWPEALSCPGVQGAGGAVYQGLEVARLSLGDPDAAFDRGCEMWRESRGSGDFLHRLEDGERAAAEHRDAFLSLCSEWSRAHHPVTSLPAAAHAKSRTSKELKPHCR